MQYESFTAYGNLSDYGWAAFYDYFQTIGHPIGDAENDFNEFKNLLLAHHYDMVVFEKLVVACPKPEYIHKNESGRLHCTSGAAIEWADGYRLYYINGRNLPAWIWEQEITRDKFLGEKNAEYRAGMYAVLGQKRVMEMLGANCVDESRDNNEILRLYKTHDVFEETGGDPLAWVQCKCPSTQTEYLLGCEPSHTSAKEAMAARWGLTAKSYNVVRAT